MKKNVQESCSGLFNSGELKVVDSRDWDRKYSRSQIECIALVETSRIKWDYGISRIKIGILLNVEMGALRLYIDSSDWFR